jgi:hypothetical protein
MEFFCFNTFGTEIALQGYNLIIFTHEKDTSSSAIFSHSKF